MEDGSDVVSDAVAIKVVALIPVVDGNEQRIDADSATLLQDKKSADRKRKSSTSEEEPEARQARLDKEAATKRLARAKKAVIKREEATTELTTGTKRKSIPEEEPEQRRARLDADAARKRLARAKQSLAMVDTVRRVNAESVNFFSCFLSCCSHK